MPVITLTSDWNQKDFYLAAVKGRLLTQAEDLKIVDISHEIKAFHIPLLRLNLTGIILSGQIMAFSELFLMKRRLRWFSWKTRRKLKE